MKPCDIGGQGVLEGVMMRSKEECALAVRKETGEIITSKWKLKQRRDGFLKWPVVRGCVSLVDMMKEGVKVISDSAKLYDESAAQEEPGKVEKYIAKKTGKSEMDVMMGVAVVVALALSVGLFFLLPSFLVGLFSKYLGSSLLISLSEGIIRILIFMGYLIFCTSIKDVRRVFMYHGAEHKTIACYEHEEELTVENVRKHRRLHPRCGTSYLLLVMIISILVYSVVGELFVSIGFVDINSNLLWRVLSRLILLPLIAGISYEVLKGAAKHENWFTRAIRWPGMQLQRLTTKEPDDSMMEVAITAFEMALGEKSEEEIKELVASFDRSEKKPAEAFAENEEKAEDAPAGIEEEKKENGQQEEASPNEG